MKLKANLLVKLTLLALITASGGCAILVPAAAGVHAIGKGLLFSTPGSEPNDDLGSWTENMSKDFQGSWRAMGRDLKKAHRTFDRVFLNYDWEDPYL